MSPAHRELSAATDPPSGLPNVSYEEALRALEQDQHEVCLAACRAALERADAARDGSVDPDGGAAPAGEPAASAVNGAPWAELRERSLAEVRRRAEVHRRAGEGGVAARWLGLLLRFDARAANSVHLAWDPAPNGSASPAPPVEAPSTGASSSSGREATLGTAPTPLGAAPRFRWAIDASGEFLCLAVEEVILAPGGIDAPRLIRRAALRGGGSWCLVAAEGRATVDGRPPRRECTRLRSGARVELLATSVQPRVTFTFRMDDPASHSARLELERGFESDEVQGLILLAAGRAGRVSVGSGVRSLIRCPDLDGALELWIDGDTLCLLPPREGWLRAADEPERRALTAESSLRLPWPLTARSDLELAPTEPGRPPLWMRLEPH